MAACGQLGNERIRHRRVVDAGGDDANSARVQISIPQRNVARATSAHRADAHARSTEPRDA
jgi:hypothetical protein